MGCARRGRLQPEARWPRGMPRPRCSGLRAPGPVATKAPLESGEPSQRCSGLRAPGPVATASDHKPAVAAEDRLFADEPQNEGQNVSHGLIDGGWRGRDLIFALAFGVLTDNAVYQPLRSAVLDGQRFVFGTARLRLSIDTELSPYTADLQGQLFGGGGLRIVRV